MSRQVSDPELIEECGPDEDPEIRRANRCVPRPRGHGRGLEIGPHDRRQRDRKVRQLFRSVGQGNEPPRFSSAIDVNRDWPAGSVIAIARRSATGRALSLKIRSQLGLGELLRLARQLFGLVAPLQAVGDGDRGEDDERARPGSPKPCGTLAALRRSRPRRPPRAGPSRTTLSLSASSLSPSTNTCGRTSAGSAFKRAVVVDAAHHRQDHGDREVTDTTHQPQQGTPLPWETARRSRPAWSARSRRFPGRRSSRTQTR